MGPHSEEGRYTRGCSIFPACDSLEPTYTEENTRQVVSTRTRNQILFLREREGFESIAVVGRNIIMSIKSGSIMFRQCMRAARSFQDYNFRNYARRRVRDEFAKGKNLSGAELESAIKGAESQLQMLRRQGIINSWYAPVEKSVMH